MIVRVSALGAAARAVTAAEEQASTSHTGADAEDDVLDVVPILAASLRNRTAVAQWVLRRQVQIGRRLRVAVVVEADAAEPAFSAESLLSAGAVVDALAEAGIDYSSPEAATAAAAFTGLKRAVGHLLTASVGGQQLGADGRREEAVAAGQVDAAEVVPRLD